MSSFNAKLEFNSFEKTDRVLDCNVYVLFSGMLEYLIIQLINSTM